MCSMLRSISSRWTGRFCSELKKPLRSLLTSNGSRRSSRLTTYGITSSGISKVVNRSPHERHSRRRRTWRPSPARRESVTFVSSKLQNGQCTAINLRRASESFLPKVPKGDGLIYAGGLRDVQRLLGENKSVPFWPPFGPFGLSSPFALWRVPPLVALIVR